MGIRKTSRSSSGIPPGNLRELLDEWNALDKKSNHDDDDYDYVDIWLKSRGVDILIECEEVYL